MEYPVTFDEFKSQYPELITAAQDISSSAFKAEDKFNQAVIEYNAMVAENLVITAFGLPAVATVEEAASAKFANGLGFAALFAGYVRQMNVENEFVPGYDGEDAGNTEASIQGLYNTMFNARFGQNNYGRQYLNIVYRAGIPVELAAM